MRNGCNTGFPSKTSFFASTDNFQKLIFTHRKWKKYPEPSSKFNFE